jgi:divalent metal cation (Fe/Co/Zn/Cd) transporter
LFCCYYDSYWWYSFATDEETGGVTGIITDAANSVKSDAGTFIAAAIGLGVIFWGAKVLWGKFKSMAK